jgi:hypothetical protein
MEAGRDGAVLFRGGYWKQGLVTLVTATDGVVILLGNDRGGFREEMMTFE